MLKLKLKGGALYIALIISIVIGVILSVFILIGYFNQKQVISRQAYTQLLWNIQSAFQIAQSGGFAPEQNSIWIKNSFNDDSIKIKKLQWGSYNLVTVESKNRHQYVKQSGIFGMQSFKDTALMIAEVGRPINLAGKIKFAGACYLPKAGYKSTYIEGSSFIADGNLATFIKQSPQTIPEIKDQYAKNMENCFADLNSKTDSIVGNIDVINNSFSSKTAVYQAGQLNLQSNILKGNVKLMVSGKVVIEKSAVLDGILIVAKKVFIKKDFVGSLHIIASDSIILEENCFLKYPSSLTVLRRSENTGQNLCGVFMKEKCKVQGSVMAISKEQTGSKVMVGLNKECEVYGLVYSSNYAGIQGKVFGNVFSERLLLKTPSAVYENHLLNAELDSRKHCKSLVIPAVFEKSKVDKPVKWL
jgi:type II secretory pathway pseudopilin PulG